jgi:type IV pilus assembly protein PilX
MISQRAIALGNKQKGVALFLTLTILLILTILGVSSVQTTSMQERMARNYRDVNIAFQGAEAAVAEAEEYLEGIANIGAFPDDDAVLLCAAGLCNSIDGTARWSQNFGYVDWSTSSTFKTTTTTAAELGAADTPKYIIEYVAKVTIEADTLNIGNVGASGSSGRAYVFRITTRGAGGTTEAAAMIQSLYGRQF